MSREVENFKKEVLEIGLIEKNNFEKDLKHRKLAFDRLALRTTSVDKQAQKRWYEDVKNYYRDFHGTLAIEYVNPNSQVEWIFPLKGNEKVIGKELNQSGRRKEALEKSISNRTGSYTEPLDLIQGGRGFLSFHPIFDTKNKYLGYIVGVFHGERYFSKIEGFNFHMRILIEGGLVFSNFSKIENKKLIEYSQSIPLNLSGATGRLEIVPNFKFYQSFKSSSKAFEFVLGLYLIGLLASMLILFYLNYLIKKEEAKLNKVELARLSYAGKLSAGLAHEINNPLAIVKASTTRLARHIRFTDSKSKKIIDDMNVAVSRIQKLIQKLVFFVEKPAINQAPVSLTQLTTESIELHSKDLEGIHVEIRSYLGSDYLIKYPKRLKLCLDQLFNNSIEALKGRLDAKIILKLSENSRFVTVEIIDNGIGIEKENMDDIFSPFYSTKSLSSGAGLGLSFVEKVVKDLNGQVKITSKVQAGTTVNISLPKKELLTENFQSLNSVR